MRVIRNYSEMDGIEGEKALIGVYVDRCYSYEKMQWLVDARTGFNQHAGLGFHILIPTQHGYGVDSWIEPVNYDTSLANEIIRRTEIQDSFDDLPCIVFRASRNDVSYADRKYFALKLGGTSKEEFIGRIGAVANLANKCMRDGPDNPADYRDYVNMRVAQHCSREQVLHCGRRSLPALATLIGLFANLRALV